MTYARRFRCESCKRVRAIVGIVVQIPECDWCKAPGPMVEIDKDGHAMPIDLSRAPAMERPAMSEDVRKHVDEKARKLVLSALEES